MIRHVVMWELHDPAQASAFRDALLPCARLVGGMRDCEVAIHSDTLPASVHVCLIATFDDADALERYQTHPLHKEVSQRIGPLRKQRHISTTKSRASGMPPPTRRRPNSVWSSERPLAPRSLRSLPPQGAVRSGAARRRTPSQAPRAARSRFSASASSCWPSRTAASISVRSITSRCAWLPPKR